MTFEQLQEENARLRFLLRKWRFTQHDRACPCKLCCQTRAAECPVTGEVEVSEMTVVERADKLLSDHFGKRWNEDSHLKQLRLAVLSALSQAETEEREACVKVADEYLSGVRLDDGGPRGDSLSFRQGRRCGAADVATAIRARGLKPVTLWEIGR